MEECCLPVCGFFRGAEFFCRTNAALTGLSVRKVQEILCGPLPMSFGKVVQSTAYSDSLPDDKGISMGLISYTLMKGDRQLWLR